MAARPNYFVVLELDPEEEDWAAIEARILEKRRQWSRDRIQGAPANQRRAERNLALLDDIERLLADPTSRQREREAARALQAKEQRAREDDLLQALKLLAAKGHAGRRDIDQLEKRYSGHFSREKIHELATASGVELLDESEAPAESFAELDPALASTIERNLEHLEVVDLYGFLALPTQTSCHQLVAAADRIYKEVQRIGKSDVDSSARSELAGAAMSVFRTVEERARYDSWRDGGRLRSLDARFTDACSGDRAVYPGVLDEMVRLAQSSGVAPDRARAYFVGVATRRKWTLVRTSDTYPVVALLRCGFCATIATDVDQGHCAGCGEALVASCPRCDTPTPTQQAACSACGFLTGDAAIIRDHMERGRGAVGEGRLDEALRHFELVLSMWPEHRAAERLRGEVARLTGERDDAVEAVRVAIRAKRYIHGRGLLDAMRSPPADLAASVEEAVATAEAHYRTGERARSAGDGERAVDSYLDALDVCSDHEAARAALARVPPPRPASLAVRSVAGGFSVSWPRVDAHGDVSYRVVRQARGTPRSPTDGSTRDVMGTECEDLDAEHGVFWHFSVWSVRGGVFSESGAASGPHLLMAEVEGLTATPADGAVVLRWSRPRGSAGVEVWRGTDRPPEAPGDGTLVRVSEGFAHDTGLTNLEPVTYRVVTFYEGPGGATDRRSTPGRVVTTIPVRPPDAVTDLELTPDGRHVCLRWSSPTDGDVQIRRARSAPPLDPGATLDVSELDTVGDLVPRTAVQEARCSAPTNGRHWYVPLTVLGHTAVVGHACSHLVVAAPTALTARFERGDVYLVWTWPAHVAQAIVELRLAGDGESARAEQTHRINRASFEADGHFVCRGLATGKYEVVVRHRAVDAEVYSEPATAVVFAQGETIDMRYRLRARKTFLRRIEGLEIVLEPIGGRAVGFKLRGLVAAINERRLPTDIDDGCDVIELDEVELQGGSTKVKFASQPRYTGHFLKLFFRDPADARRFRLLHPRREELRLP